MAKSFIMNERLRRGGGARSRRVDLTVSGAAADDADLRGFTTRIDTFSVKEYIFKIFWIKL